MAENTKIAWCDMTFNPWIGCMKVGPGCDHCYAETLATARLGVAWGAGAPRRRTAESTWKQPLAWNRRAAKLGIRYRVFCSSLADVFDNDVDPAWRVDLAMLIIATPHLDWLLLTKRIGNAKGFLWAMFGATMPTNVWLGATIVNREEMLRDGPKLEATPAIVRFWSVEPMLGDLGEIPLELMPDWIIVGGESGPGARPMHPDWARSLRDQCAAAGVPFLFKQHGEWLPYGEIDAEGHQNSRTMGEKPGAWHEWGAGEGFSVRVGKRQAGRHLDGVQHDGVPA
ncbi:phage Gp37/Gp68 family protein [Rhizorhabdus histidinilytica]|uniref:phage Gp37/Gp68 family protein n=1 Tax=Rhizorhabdus histidinilytica TaxID=439228 RepID=UPI0032208AD8